MFLNAQLIGKVCIEIDSYWTGNDSLTQNLFGILLAPLIKHKVLYITIIR